MKITFNSYQPNFKAISLNEEERKEVSTALNTIKKGDISEFQRNILNSEVMDVFLPHIKEEAAKTDDPKAKSVDLSMKMFDGLNTFADKKDPVGWMLSLLNGTNYRDPKPTIFDILEQQYEEESLANLNREPKVVNHKESRIDLDDDYMYFDIDDSRTYTRHEIFDRAKDLQSYFGPECKLKSVLKVVEKNPYLVDYDNELFDGYINEFAESVGLTKNVISDGILSHPELMRCSYDSINDCADKFAQVSGCRSMYCKSAIIKNPLLMNRDPEVLRQNLDAHNFYRHVCGKAPVQPESIFSNAAAKQYYTNALIFLVSSVDLSLSRNSIRNGVQLAQQISEHGEKQYRLVIPEDNNTPQFMDFVKDFSMEHFGKEIFEFEVVDPKEFRHNSKSLVAHKTQSKSVISKDKVVTESPELKNVDQKEPEQKTTGLMARVKGLIATAGRFMGIDNTNSL